MGVNSVTDGDGLQVVRPEVVLPVQFFGGLRKHAPHQGGEFRLLVALLEDAVYCFQRYACSRDSRGRRLFDDAARWIGTDDDGSPSRSFSFEYVCAVLDFDAAHLRRHLHRWLERRRAYRPTALAATARPPLRRAPDAAPLTWGE
ncbi:MAG: hypothetical protein H6Q33_3550 [Deltaproteobacteria bacterium]|nr:hypothetical protein [Deltaproteobacteria bacterium]